MTDALGGSGRDGALTEAQLSDELGPEYRELPPALRGARNTISWWQVPPRPHVCQALPTSSRNLSAIWCFLALQQCPLSAELSPHPVGMPYDVQVMAVFASPSCCCMSGPCFVYHLCNSNMTRTHPSYLQGARPVCSCQVCMPRVECGCSVCM